MRKQQCVTSRARNAIGLGFSPSSDLAVAVGDPADLIVFGSESTTSTRSFRARTTTQSVVNDAGQDRTTIFRGRIIDRI